MAINPFLIYGYISPEYFCNRNIEAQRLISAAENNRNLTLQSMRRLGKTSLLYHFFYGLRAKKKFRTIYFDLQLTQNLNDFLNFGANAVARNLYSKQLKLVKEFMGVFRAIRPALKLDPKTGTPSLELGIQSEQQARHTFEDMFNYIREYSKKYKIIIAIDEFQQILYYPEKNMEAIIRSQVQTLPLVSFIFSGSSKHLMTEMFVSAKRPFYQSTEMMILEKLDENEYCRFIVDKFLAGRKQISLEDASYILSRCSVYTFYVQVLCNRIFSSEHKQISRKIIDEVLEDIVKEYEQVYYSYKNLMTDYQWEVTKAVAREGIVKNPTSSDFIAKHNLKAASSVKSAIKSLIEKEILYKERDSYFIYDVFFGRWLETL